MAYEAPLPIDYVTKDYEGFLQYLTGIIPTLLPEWTDLSESDQGMVILQLACYGLHILSYYQDKNFNEAFLVTAKQRESIIKGCRFLGYELDIQEAATSTVTFTKYADKLNNIVTIPTGTKVSTDPKLGNVVYFETDVELIIPAGTLSASVAVTQGETYADQLIGVGNNATNQQVTISRENILINDMSIYTIESLIEQTWTKVDDFLDSITTSRHYTATVESTMYSKITFGNGVNGQKVPLNAPIYSTYRVGGGTVGNVAIGKINYLYDDISEIESVTNAVAATGGLDFEEVEAARMTAPKRYKTLNRAITPADFEAIAEDVSGVAHAKAVEIFNTNGDVYLYIVPTSYGVPSSALLSEVSDKITEIMVLNNNLSVFATEYVDYNVTLSIVVGDTYVNADKKTEIETLLETKTLNPLYFSHGESILTNYIAGAIYGIEGVRSVIIDAYTLGATPADGLYCGSTQFLKLNTLTVSVTGGI